MVKQCGFKPTCQHKMAKPEKANEYAHYPSNLLSTVFYQDHYLDIIQDSAQYFTPVAGAEIRLWPLATKQLYLGDLLQLWFAEKWLVEQERQFSFEIFLNTPETRQKNFIFMRLLAIF